MRTSSTKNPFMLSTVPGLQTPLNSYISRYRPFWFKVNLFISLPLKGLLNFSSKLSPPLTTDTKASLPCSEDFFLFTGADSCFSSAGFCLASFCSFASACLGFGASFSFFGAGAAFGCGKLFSSFSYDFVSSPKTLALFIKRCSDFAVSSLSLRMMDLTYSTRNSW